MTIRGLYSRWCPVLILMCGTFILEGQKFHFGIGADVVFSQVDGDNLRGFNHIGYAVIALGGFSIDEDQWVVVEFQRITHGSTKKNETSTPRVDLDLTGFNVFLGYSIRFGDSWDGVKRFRVMAGPRFNSISEVSSHSVEEEDLSKTYLSGTIGLSYLLSPDLLLNLSYTHTFGDIMEKPLEGLDDITKLVPYYLAFGASYYFNFE